MAKKHNLPSPPRLFTANEPQQFRIYPDLAVEIGLDPSIALLQIDWLVWLAFQSGNTRHYVDGQWWFYMSLRDWKRSFFKFWSVTKIYRVLTALEEAGYIKSRPDLNRIKWDKTRWYTTSPAGCSGLQSIRVDGYEPPEPQDMPEEDEPGPGVGVFQNETGQEGVFQNETGESQNETTIPETPTRDSLEEEEGETDSVMLREPEHIPIDDDGEEIPREFDKHSPFFRKIMGNLLGTPRNLQGKERAAWMENIQRRAAEDLDYKRWCIWQSENNARGKTVRVFIEFCLSEGDFAAWKIGKFKPKDELQQAGVSRGIKKPAPEEPKSEIQERFDKMQLF